MKMQSKKLNREKKVDSRTKDATGTNGKQIASGGKVDGYKRNKNKKLKKKPKDMKN